jgi:hypothetical protein
LKFWSLSNNSLVRTHSIESRSTARLTRENLERMEFQMAVYSNANANANADEAESVWIVLFLIGDKFTECQIYNAVWFSESQRIELSLELVNEKQDVELSRFAIGSNEVSVIWNSIHGQSLETFDYRNRDGMENLAHWNTIQTEKSKFDVSDVNVQIHSQFGTDNLENALDFIDDAYLSHIFNPCHFPLFVIRQSVLNYFNLDQVQADMDLNQIVVEDCLIDSTKLSELLVFLIRKSAESNGNDAARLELDRNDEQVKIELNERKKQSSIDQWNKFVNRCLEMWTIAHQPLGLFYRSDDSAPHAGNPDRDAGKSSLYIFRNGFLSIVRECDALETLAQPAAEKYQRSALFNAFDRSRQSNELIRDMCHLAKIGESIENCLGSENLIAFENDLRNSISLSDALNKLNIKLIGASELDSILSEEARKFSGKFLRDLQKIRQLNLTIDRLIDLFGLYSNVALTPCDESESSLLLSFVSNSCDQLAASRWTIARNLLLILSLFVRLSPANEAIRMSLIHRVSLIAENCFISWQFAHRYATHSTSLVDGLPFAQLSIHSHSKSNDSTLFSLFYRIHPKSKFQTRARSSNIAKAITDRAEIAWRFVTPAQDLLDLAKWLLDENQMNHLNVLVNFQSILFSKFDRSAQTNWGMFQFYSGHLFLNNKQPKKALDCFMRAAQSIRESDSNVLRVCSDEMKIYAFGNRQLSESTDALLIVFYLMCIPKFEEKSFHQEAVQLANAAISGLTSLHSHSSDRDWIKLHFNRAYNFLFKNFLELKEWDNAFLSIVSNADTLPRSENIQRLIVTMCKNNEIQRICQFPSVQGSIELIAQALLERALASDVASLPRYHDVLYAFHVFHGNFIDAAKCMYQYSVKLARESLSAYEETLFQQSNCYLAAINALSMIDADRRFFVYGEDHSIESKSPKRDIDESIRFRSDSRSVVVITIDDLQLKYSLARAAMLLNYPPHHSFQGRNFVVSFFVFRFHFCFVFVFRFSFFGFVSFFVF